jgi:translocation and assembly module TamB
VALFAVAALLAGTGWWLGREATLQALVQKLANLSGGHVDVDGVSGSVYGAMHFAHIAYRGPARTMTAEDIDVRWAPWQFFSSGIAISELRAASLRIDSTGPSARPPSMPQTLAPPFQVGVADAQVARLTLNSPGMHNVIDKVRFKLAGDETKWVLSGASATTPWGLLAANARIGSASPFAVDATATLTQQAPAGKSAARLAVRAGGSLASTILNADGQAGPAKGTAAMSFAPFERVPLRALSIAARGIDPAFFNPAMPRADLHLALSAHIDADENVSGSVEANNLAGAGALDQQRLPLRSIAGKLKGSLSALQIVDVFIDLGGAGKLAGNGNIHGGAAPGATLALHSSHIDLKAIHGRMKSTNIAGDITLASAGTTQTLNAQLAQDGMRLDAQASIAGGQLRVEQARIAVGASSVRLTGQAGLTGTHAFKLNARTDHFNPASLGDYPVADLSGELNASGALAPTMQVAADFALRPSTLFRQPLSGSGKFNADASHVSGVLANLAFGGNSIQLRGGFGRAGEALNWRVDAGQLAAMRAELAGALNASGVVSGTLSAPRTTFELDANGFGWKRPANVGLDSTLHASGEARLGAAHALEVKAAGTARNVNPAAFGAALAGNVNGTFDIEGRAGAEWRLALALLPSTLAAAPLSGHARLGYGGARISNVDLELHLGANTLSARGGFGGIKDQLDWRLDARELAALGADFSGALQGAGAFSGSAGVPSLNGTLDGHDLRVYAHHVKTLHASANIGAGHGGVDPLAADIAVTNYTGPKATISAAHLKTTGTHAAHTLHLEARNDDFNALLDAAGRWDAGSWSGTVRTLQNRGRYAFTLQGPVLLRLGFVPGSGVAGMAHPAQIALGSAFFKLADGSVTLNALDKNGARWTTRGTATGVPLNYLAQGSGAMRDNVSGDLTLGAAWSLELTAPTAPAKTPELSGSVHVMRERGDLVVGAEVPVVLGLRQFDARADVTGGALRVQMEMEGSRAGHARVDGSAQLLHGHIDNNSALHVSAGANMGSVAWLAPLTGQPALELDGALQLALSGSGTVGAPVLNGSMSGDKLALRWTDQGVKLHDGVLRAQLSGDQLLLQRLSFEGPQGHAQADGAVRFANGEANMQLNLVADKLEILSRPDRTLVVSGQSTLTRTPGNFALVGKLKADRALFELAPLGRPTLSDDVIVLGKAGAPPKPAPSATPLTVDIEADLGQQFMLKGMGLDAQLAGTVHIHAADRRPPRATGGIRVVDGTYAAYGQRLHIERGLLNFSGPLDNPALNILAVRKRPDGEALSETNVEAGVEVRGNALAPVAKLVSTPSVPNGEKLAWLVLGHGTDNAAGQDFGVYSAAVGALLGGAGGNGIQSRLANSIGVDELGLAQAKGLETTVVMVGKRISQRAYLSFEQGASSASSLVKLRYQINPRVAVQLQTGANSALDVLYSWTFD